MDLQTFADIHQSLERAGSPSLFAYLELKQNASIRDTEASLERRRAWAESPQDTPGKRLEAMWFTQSYSKIREILLQDRVDYIRYIESRLSDSQLDRLEMFIRGTLVHGELTALAEISVLNQASRLGIPEDITLIHLDRILSESGLHRPGELPDHYAAMGVHPHIAQERLEEFHQRRRKWVNNIQDPEKFRRLHTELEAAWRVLGDPEQRRLYDHQYVRLYPEPPPLDELQPITPASTTGDVEAVVAAAAEPALSPLAPKLVVDAPDLIRLKPARKPISMTLTVRNAGRGEMRGEVRVDQPWASVTPATLDPRSPEQVITLTVDPMAMPTDRGEVRVSISTRRCGSRAVIVDARRRVYIKPILTAGAVLVAAALIGVPLLVGLQRMTMSAQTHLIIRADPPTGDISIAGRPMGINGVIDAHEHFPIDEPFTVRIDAAGYHPWESEITVTSGEIMVLTPELRLADTLDFHPVAADSRADLSANEVGAALEPFQTSLASCLEEERPTVRGYVSPLGVLIGLEVLSGGDSGVERCLRRQLRAVPFPQRTTSSYAAFELML